MLEQLGRWVVLLGLALVVAGAALWLFGRLAPSGRLLPGDLVVRRPGMTIYLPLATSIVVSVVLTALLWLVSWLRR